MERRTFLASVSASVPLAVAGCMGESGDEPSTTSESNGTTAEPTTQATTEQPTDSGPLSVGEAASLSDGRELAVVDAGASAFVVTRGDADEQIHAEDGERFIRVKFAPDGIEDYRSFVEDNVRVTVNERSEGTDHGAILLEPVFPIGGGPSRFDAAWSIPTDVTPYTATVTLDAGEETYDWVFDAEHIEAITQTVDYTVGSLSAPDSVAPGESFTAELPVENEGDAVEFYAVLTGTANAPTRIAEDLPGGEETTIEVDATAPERSDGGDQTGAEVGFEFALDWGHGAAAATVDYE